jgi:hypothetical protein
MKANPKTRRKKGNHAKLRKKAGTDTPAQLEFGLKHAAPPVSQMEVIVLPTAEEQRLAARQQKKTEVLAERRRLREEKAAEERRVEALLAEWDGAREDVEVEEKAAEDARQFAAAARIQGAGRGWMGRRLLARWAAAATRIEAVARGWGLRMLVAGWHLAATEIARHACGWQRRTRYRRMPVAGFVVKLPGTAAERERCVLDALKAAEDALPPLLYRPDLHWAPAPLEPDRGSAREVEMAREAEDAAGDAARMLGRKDEGLRPEVLVLPAGGRFTFKGPKDSLEPGDRIGWEPDSSQWFKSRGTEVAAPFPRSPKAKHGGPLVTAELTSAERQTARATARMTMAAGHQLLAMHRRRTGPGTTVFCPRRPGAVKHP